MKVLSEKSKAALVQTYPLLKRWGVALPARIIKQIAPTKETKGFKPFRLGRKEALRIQQEINRQGSSGRFIVRFDATTKGKGRFQIGSVNSYVRRLDHIRKVNTSNTSYGRKTTYA